MPIVSHSPLREVHAQITDQLIAAIEAVPGAPTLPWRHGRHLMLPANALTGKPYNGINVIALWIASMAAGFAQPQWATYRQWSALGAQVRKGERASCVVFYKEFSIAPDQKKSDDDGKRRIARASAVFNAAQVEGFAVPSTRHLDLVERLDHADCFVRATGARIEFGGDRAFFRPSSDHIQMPDEDLFEGTKTMTRTEGFYATIFHELVHWSGADHRLHRVFGQRFGDHAYAAEELVAEIGAAFLCAELGVTPAVRPDHAEYLQSWLQLLKTDNRAIFTAASKAAEAAKFLLEMGASTALPKGTDQIGGFGDAKASGL